VSSTFFLPGQFALSILNLDQIQTAPTFDPQAAPLDFLVCPEIGTYNFILKTAVTVQPGGGGAG
jgi:hypothetical protein